MKKINSQIQLHFDGDIASGHQIPIRVLGKSLVHMQNAIDRAYLDIKYGGVWKNARMKKEDYEICEFIAEAPSEGGYIFDFFSTIKESVNIVDRVASAISEAKLQGSIQVALLKDQVQTLKDNLLNSYIAPTPYPQSLNQKNNDIQRAYGFRSIAKEIDQVISPLRQEHSGDSNLVILFTGSSSQKFDFNKKSSDDFHRIVSRRSLSKPILYRGKLKVLDKINLRGKFQNSDSNKISTIHFQNQDDFLRAHPFLGTESDMFFIGSPIIEFGSIEPNSGDIYFLNIADPKTFHNVS